MLPPSPRPLLRALTASVLIHAALLLSLASVFVPPRDTPATTISAAIRSSDRRATAPADPPSTPVAQSLPAPAERPALRVREAVEPSPAAPAALTLTPAGSAPISAAPAPASSAAPLSPSAAASPPASSASVASAPRGAPSANPGSARPGVSADDLRQYSMSLGIAARRFKRYPALARERGWEGRAEVALIFSAVLPLPEVVLTQSSGRTVLDEQAVDMMTQASRVASLPEGLKARDFRLSKSVEFSLENDQ